MHTYIDFLPPTIEAIWIFTKDGIPLIAFSGKKGVNSALMGGFLSALKGFSTTMTGGNFSSFTSSGSLFTLVPCNNDNVLIFCRSPLKTKEKKILNVCRSISNMFESCIGNLDFTNWNGEISVFDDFKRHLKLYFKMSNL